MAYIQETAPLVPTHAAPLIPTHTAQQQTQTHLLAEESLSKTQNYVPFLAKSTRFQSKSKQNIPPIGSSPTT